MLYVSFGTTISLSKEQIKELALGLEESKQKFIWLLRDADKGDIFAADIEGQSAQLPKGFEERINEVGMVVRDWVPQLEILEHVSTGGFLSHCGWNSCMDSMSMEVPIAAWPMHSDQPKNAVRPMHSGNRRTKSWGGRQAVVHTAKQGRANEIIHHCKSCQKLNGIKTRGRDKEKGGKAG